MYGQDCTNIDNKLFDLYTLDYLPGLRHERTFKNPIPDNDQVKGYEKSITPLLRKSSTEYLNQKFNLIMENYLSYNEINLSIGVIDIVIFDKNAQKLLNLEKISYKYSDFYFEGMCLLGCNAAPHTDAELTMIAEVTRHIEFYFSEINLISDYYLRSKMDTSGWVKCKIVYFLPKIQEMKITFDSFIMACGHSLQVYLRMDKKLLRTNRYPEYWVNDLNPTDPRISEILSNIPKVGTVNCDAFRRFLTVNGCHQRMAQAYNEKIKSLLFGKVPDISKHYIHNIPEMNKFDQYCKKFL